MGILDIVLLISSHFYCITISAQSMNQLKTYMYCCVLAAARRSGRNRIQTVHIKSVDTYYNMYVHATDHFKKYFFTLDQ